MDATDIVTYWARYPSSNYGVMIKDETENDTSHWTTFYSSDASASHRPKLVIYYMDFTFVSTSLEGYYIPGNTYYITACLANCAASTTLTLITPYFNDNTNVYKINYHTGLSYQEALAARAQIGMFSKASGAGLYYMYFTPTASSFRNSKYEPYQWITRNFCLEVTQDGHTLLFENDQVAYVTLEDISFYTTNDCSFYYNSPTDNSFRGYATIHYSYGSQEDFQPLYNCMAYAVGVNYEWVWPTTNVNESFKDALVREMNSYGYVEQNSARYTDLIYYENGHVAKVTAYDINGYPSAIISKWGAAELIESDGYDVFSSDTYGSPLYYFREDT